MAKDTKKPAYQGAKSKAVRVGNGSKSSINVPLVTATKVKPRKKPVESKGELTDSPANSLLNTAFKASMKKLKANKKKNALEVKKQTL